MEATCCGETMTITVVTLGPNDNEPRTQAYTLRLRGRLSADTFVRDPADAPALGDDALLLNDIDGEVHALIAGRWETFASARVEARRMGTLITARGYVAFNVSDEALAALDPYSGFHEPRAAYVTPHYWSELCRIPIVETADGAWRQTGDAQTVQYDDLEQARTEAVSEAEDFWRAEAGRAAESLAHTLDLADNTRAHVLHQYTPPAE